MDSTMKPNNFYKTKKQYVSRYLEETGEVSSDDNNPIEDPTGGGDAQKSRSTKSKFVAPKRAVRNSVTKKQQSQSRQKSTARAVGLAKKQAKKTSSPTVPPPPPTPTPLPTVRAQDLFDSEDDEAPEDEEDEDEHLDVPFFDDDDDVEDRQSTHSLSPSPEPKKKKKKPANKEKKEKKLTPQQIARKKARAAKDAKRKQLLYLVEQHNFLYNKSHPDHSNRDMTNNTWVIIAGQLDLDGKVKHSTKYIKVESKSAMYIDLNIDKVY